ncbi:MAG: acylphosphatase [Gammaproteobacteria bacterium]|nr:acylphosphatase [Gammaproteobacteria bacterium]MBU1645939.1 acylphosphatase [Gammaproteobacteria bacterium]MBU1972001.1 acylphosphatase [Gammaproteobacteria bacterium]
MTEVRHLVITGLVQGVWYRGSMVAKAQELGVTGWVRNRRDGSVEAMVSGTAEQVAAMMNWARHGPPGAHVDLLEVELGSGSYDNFEQRATD